MTNKTFGFIILRHVNDSITNTYWKHSYDCVRKYYPENTIIIIDDNSDQTIINDSGQAAAPAKELYKTHIINSEYPQRGELLPYYYYLTNRLFDTAIIIHDSVFLNKHIDINDILAVDKFRFIWDFEHHWDQTEDETRMISVFNDDELMAFYNNKHLWKGCFGSMSIITHDYLTHINSKYDISKLLGCISSRYNRCSFERVIACMLQCPSQSQTQSPSAPPPHPSLHGDIHIYAPHQVKITDLEKYRHIPIIKVWTGR